MLQFTVREMLLVLVAMGLVIAWCIDHRVMDRKLDRMKETVFDIAGKWADDAGHPVQITIPGEGVTTVTEAFP